MGWKEIEIILYYIEPFFSSHNAFYKERKKNNETSRRLIPKAWYVCIHQICIPIIHGIDFLTFFVLVFISIASCQKLPCFNMGD